MPKRTTKLIGGDWGFVQVLENLGISQNLYAPPSDTWTVVKRLISVEMLVIMFRVRFSWISYLEFLYMYNSK